MKKGNKKRKNNIANIARKIATAFICLVILSLGFYAGKTFVDEKYSYVVEDVYTNEDDIIVYLKNLMEVKYNINPEITYISKEKFQICSFQQTECLANAKVKDVYTYKFNATSRDGKTFTIKYTNGYKQGDKKVLHYVYDNYYMHANNVEIQKLLGTLQHHIVTDMDQSLTSIIIYKSRFNRSDVEYLIRELTDYLENAHIIFVEDEKDFIFLEDYNSVLNEIGWSEDISINGKLPNNSYPYGLEFKNMISFPMVYSKNGTQKTVYTY